MGVAIDLRDALGSTIRSSQRGTPADTDLTEVPSRERATGRHVLPERRAVADRKYPLAVALNRLPCRDEA
jgi:hypothetical protein